MATTGGVPTPPQPDDWATFLANVDSAVPPTEVLQKALVFLQVDCGLQDPRSAMGVQREDLRNHPKWPADDLTLVSFLGRVACTL